MTTCRCGAIWTGMRLEHCTVCHETFTGTTAGDKHRTGSYFPDERRCLSAGEMREKGMTQNARGYWRSGGETERWWDADSEASGVAVAAEQPSEAPGGHHDDERAGEGRG